MVKIARKRSRRPPSDGASQQGQIPLKKICSRLHFMFCFDASFVLAVPCAMCSPRPPPRSGRRQAAAGFSSARGLPPRGAAGREEAAQRDAQMRACATTILSCDYNMTFDAIPITLALHGTRRRSAFTCPGDSTTQPASPATPARAASAWRLM